MGTVTFVVDPVASNPSNLIAFAILTGLCYFITYKIVNNVFFECKKLVYILTMLIGFIMAIVFDYILYSLLSIY